MDSQHQVETTAAAGCPSKLVCLPAGAIRVDDADEETFDLYSTLSLLSKDSANTSSSNLGMVDGKKDVLILSLTVNPPPALVDSSSNASSRKSTGRSSGKKSRATAPSAPIEFDILITQDMQRLRGSGGDTGSVVWRSSLHLLSYLLPQLHFPSLTPTPLFSPQLLSQATVLELGSGTGLLAIPLAPFVKRWVCSDQADCLKLVAANLASNGLKVGSLEEEKGEATIAGGDKSAGAKKVGTNVDSGKAGGQGPCVGVEELDWFSFLPGSSSTHALSPTMSSGRPLYDLIVCSDCIYNPHLLPPLIATFSHFAVPDHTIVLVVIELRSADVIQEFLELWIEEGEGRWEFRRLVGDDAEGGWGAGGGRFAGWSSVVASCDSFIQIRASPAFSPKHRFAPVSALGNKLLRGAVGLPGFREGFLSDQPLVTSEARTALVIIRSETRRKLVSSLDPLPLPFNRLRQPLFFSQRPTITIKLGFLPGMLSSLNFPSTLFSFGLPPRLDLCPPASFLVETYDQEASESSPQALAQASTTLRLPDLAAELQFGETSVFLPRSVSLRLSFLFPSLAAIISHLSRADLIALSLTSRYLAETVAPFLWRTIHIDGVLPNIRSVLESIRATLSAKPYLASCVRTLNVELEAGEFATGNEWRLVGEIASLLPDVVELDLRSDSVGRWKGIWDPFLQVMSEKGRRWERLERVAVAALVSDTTLVHAFLATHPGIRRLSLTLTHISSVYSMIPAQLTQPYNEFTSQSEDEWTLSSARLPIDLDPGPPDVALLPNLTAFKGAPLTLLSILGCSPSKLESIELDLGHPFGEAAKAKMGEDVEAVLTRATSLTRLALNGGVKPDELLMERVARAAPQLENLDIVDSIGFFYKPPPSPLSPVLLLVFPNLKSIHLRAWGYFDTNLLHPLPPTPLPPNANPVERVSLVSFVYEVEEVRTEDGTRQRVGVFSLLQAVELGQRKLGEAWC